MDAREFHDQDMIKLILNGILVRVKINRKARDICLLVTIGVRRDCQKILLRPRNIDG